MARSYTTAKELNELTSRIIGASIDVHRALGPGLLESAYQVCLAHELKLRELEVERHPPVPLLYKDVQLTCVYRPDLIVERAVLIEVKAIEVVAPIHTRQLGTYVRLAGLHVGLLLNFGAMPMTQGVHRSVNQFPSE